MSQLGLFKKRGLSNSEAEVIVEKILRGWQVLGINHEGKLGKSFLKIQSSR